MLKMFSQTYIARKAPEDRAHEDRSRKNAALYRFLSLVALTFDLWPQIRIRAIFLYSALHLSAKFHHPTFNRSEVTVLTNKQTPLKTSTSLRYATPVGKHTRFKAGDFVSASDLTTEMRIRVSFGRLRLYGIVRILLLRALLLQMTLSNVVRRSSSRCRASTHQTVMTIYCCVSLTGLTAPASGHRCLPAGQPGLRPMSVSQPCHLADSARSTR